MTLATMPDDRKKLLYRAMHRGFKEADIIIGSFAEDHLPTMTDEEVTEFERLLDVPDQELYGWIIRRTTVPENYRLGILARLQEYEVATAMADKMAGRR